MSVQHRHEMGPVGQCVCPKCGAKTLHKRGVPCQEQHCSECGTKLLREGSYHYQLFEQKHAKTDKHD